MHTTVPTYTCNIFMGYREGYNGKEVNQENVKSYLRQYCDKAGFAFSIFPIYFVYSGGEEHGCMVEIINYPRFPSTPDVLKQRAIEIAEMLLKEFKQYRISVVCTDETIMVE